MADLYEKDVKDWTPADIDRYMADPNPALHSDWSWQAVANRRGAGLDLINTLELHYRSELPDNFAAVLRRILWKA